MMKKLDPSFITEACQVCSQFIAPDQCGLPPLEELMKPEKKRIKAKKSKFDFEYMSNDKTECVAFNKDRWTKEEALKQACHELDTEHDDPLEIFESFVRFGYFRSVDGEVYNTWYLDDLEQPVIIEARNKVAVWVVRKKEQ